MSTTAEVVAGRDMTDFGCDADGCTRALLLSGEDSPALRRLVNATNGWHTCGERVFCPTHHPHKPATTTETKR